MASITQCPPCCLQYHTENKSTCSIHSVCRHTDVINRYCSRQEPEFLYDIYLSRRYARLEPPLDGVYTQTAMDSATSCSMFCSSYCPLRDPADGIDFVPPNTRCDWWIYNSSEYTSPLSSITPRIQNYNCYLYQADDTVNWNTLHQHYQPGVVSGQRQTGVCVCVCVLTGVWLFLTVLQQHGCFLCVAATWVFLTA